MLWIAYGTPLTFFTFVCAATVASNGGYADKSHQIRQVKELEKELPGCRRGMHLDSESQKCISCIAGVNFMSKEYNTELECFPCTKCYGLHQPVTPCTVFQDVVCRCPVGYRDTVENLCAKELSGNRPALPAVAATSVPKVSTVSSSSTLNQRTESTTTFPVSQVDDSLSEKAAAESISSTSESAACGRTESRPNDLFSDVSKIANQGFIIIVVMLAVIGIILLYPATTQMMKLVKAFRRIRTEKRRLIRRDNSSPLSLTQRL